MTSWKDADRDPRHGLRRWPVWIGLAATSTVAALLIGAGALALVARSAMATSSRMVTGAVPAAPTWAPHPLGSDHAVTIREHGIPQAFTILFYEEDGTPVRGETWSYYDQGLEVDFVDGELQGERTIDMATGDVIPVPYRPDQFAAFMSLAEVLASAQIDHYLVVPLEDGLVKGGEIYYADEIMFGLKDGALRYVQVLALEGEE